MTGVPAGVGCCVPLTAQAATGRVTAWHQPAAQPPPIGVA